jgi:hypothetical protein
MRPGVPRRFWLTQDSRSGATIVAEGTQSSQGQVVVFDSPARIWPTIDALLASQPGTQVHWLDTDRILARCIP